MKRPFWVLRKLVGLVGLVIIAREANRAITSP